VVEILSFVTYLIYRDEKNEKLKKKIAILEQELSNCRDRLLFQGRLNGKECEKSVNAIWGKWPGRETDEEIVEIIEKMS